MAAFTVVLSPDPDGGYSASCPAMPGAVSQGETREETLHNIAEAMTGWWEVASEDGRGPRDETAQLVDDEIAFLLNWKAEAGYELLVETATVHVDAPHAVGV